MPSPDISQYVDLTVYDKQPVDIYDEAIAYARTALPDWTPVAGSIEDAVLQAAASMTGYLGGAINRLPSSLFEGLLQLMKIARSSGTPASASITVTTVNNFGYTLPAGTRFGFYDNTDIDNPILYTFDTVADLTIAAGATTGTVTATAALLGQYPSLPAGTTIQLVTPVAFVQSAVLATALNPGTSGETDTEYFSRALGILNSYSSAMVLPRQYEQYLLSTYTGVYRAKAYSRVNPAANNVGDALQNGYLTIYACGVNGASISPAVTTPMLADVVARSTAGLSIAINPPTIVPITCSVTVTYKPGFLGSEVIAAVTESLNTYLHPDYWDWSEYIYQNELIARLDQVAGVGRVVSVSIPVVAGITDAGNGDRRFAKRGALPRVTATVTVS